ncbi:hypothetical protein SLEP1_g55702 [Rubroshorea leprosula]|uniref:Reverse transcriptase n=1 Tax=Rubroshorea leprosula TaxID=152421 RepID=A0AAV5MGJ8_9ROSI|nr:hypothetical protein SLEP1_g55702 [Rubroshorea leprosula]
MCYFSSLFSSISPNNIEQVTSYLSPRVTEVDNAFLLQMFIETKIKKALHQMHPSKGPRPDGLSSGFFQRFWDVVKADVVLPCLEFLNHKGAIPLELNFTHIVLIPKCNEPRTMADLWPISLCNVIYRIIAKVIANKLKMVLQKVISQEQSAFLPNQLITNNFMIAYEILQYMRTRKVRKWGWQAVKLDMSKAFDLVEWPYLEQVMGAIGFAEELEHILNRYWWGRGEDEHKIHWMEWRKLATSKKARGLGFRAMREFNLSMLGKQGWRLLTCPDSLATRLMKAKYFPCCRRLIGDGRSTEIWNDLWLPGNEQFYVQSPRLEGCTLRFEDNCLWHFTKHGSYTVRSGYHRAINMARNHVRPSASSTIFGGNRLWSLDIPEKVRLFIWSAYKNVIPTKDNLHKKRAEVDLECSMCGMEKESVFHSLMSCSLARTVWLGCPLNLHVSKLQVDDFATFFDNTACILGKEQFELFYLLGATVMQKATKTRWHPPDLGFIKLNVDGATSVQSAAFGMGALARNDSGEVLATMACKGQGAAEPEVVEACSLQSSLHWAQSLAFGRIIVESDCATIVSAITSETFNMNSSLGLILLDCKALLASFKSCRLQHVRRTANAVAHELARRALTTEANEFWVDDIPFPIEHIVTGDQSLI